MTLDEAAAILTDWCGKRPSSMTRAAKQRLEARSKGWWLENSPAQTPVDSKRSKAYLIAYIEIAGGRLPVDGLKLDDGFLYLDRGVMGAMLHGGYVSWERSGCDPYFKLTPKGRQLIRPS